MSKIKVKKIIPLFIVLSFVVCLYFPNLAKADGAVTGAVVGANAGTSSSNAATTCIAPKDIPKLFDYARCVISSSIIPFVIGLGVLLFLIGVVQYVSSGDNEEQREASRNMMIYGIIAIFVMVSVWGIVKILSTTFGFDYTMPSLPPSATTNP